MLLLGLVEQASPIFLFCYLVVDFFACCWTTVSLLYFVVMNVMQTQVTIARESKKGDIIGLAASKGQDSLDFFTYLTGPRWSRAISPSRSRRLLPPSIIDYSWSAGQTRGISVHEVGRTRRTVLHPGGEGTFFEGRGPSQFTWTPTCIWHACRCLSCWLHTACTSAECARLQAHHC